MTPEQLDEIEARANQAADHVAMLCTKEERWRMSVPPKDSDSDLMLMQVLETDVSQLVSEVKRLQGQEEAVEKLHRPSTEKVDGAGVTYRMCLHCTYINRYGQQRYPCPTIQALEGESDD